MKKLALALAPLLILAALPVFAHHAAEGIVDEDVYAMIDALVADTPHADLTLDDLGGGMTEMTIDGSSLNGLESMVEGGLFKYMMMLKGTVSTTITIDEFDQISLTILHTTTTDKAASEVVPASWGELKAGYR